MTFDLARIYAFLTWPACGTIFFIASCRLNAMPKNTRFLVVVEYSIWAAIGVGVPCLPFIGEYPGLGTVVLLYALVAVLLCSARAWAGDVAPDEATDSAPLEPVTFKQWMLEQRIRVLVAWERFKERIAASLERLKGTR